MTVVAAYVGGEKIDPPDNSQQLSSTASTVLIEGIAQNTTGNVFVPEVILPHSDLLLKALCNLG